MCMIIFLSSLSVEPLFNPLLFYTWGNVACAILSLFRSFWNLFDFPPFQSLKIVAPFPSFPWTEAATWTTVDPRFFTPPYASPPFTFLEVASLAWWFSPPPRVSMFLILCNRCPRFVFHQPAVIDFPLSPMKFGFSFGTNASVHTQPIFTATPSPTPSLPPQFLFPPRGHILLLVFPFSPKTACRTFLLFTQCWSFPTALAPFKLDQAGNFFSLSFGGLANPQF